jgi:DNA mismatch endonuclease, patch repair protein
LFRQLKKGSRDFVADVLTPTQRSANMAAIKGKDTKPERVVRSIVYALGYRYRLHRKDLPGKPDLVFSRHRKVILVHGCYWHMHDCRYGRVVPVTNPTFWKEKRATNVERDRRNENALREAGWAVLIVWECSMRNPDLLAAQIREFLASHE